MSKKTIVNTRVKLTNDDIENYNHNKREPLTNYTGNCVVIADRQAVDRELERLGIIKTGNLNKGRTPPRFCVKDKKLITAPKDKERKNKQFNKTCGVKVNGGFN